MAVEGLPLETR